MVALLPIAVEFEASPGVLDMLVLYEKKLGRSAALSLLNNVYKSPSNYTDQSKYALALRKNLIENITE